MLYKVVRDGEQVDILIADNDKDAKKQAELNGNRVLEVRHNGHGAMLVVALWQSALQARARA